MKRSSRILTLLLALTLATVAALGAWSLTSDDEPDNIGAANIPTPTAVPTADVVVAIADIASATLITSEMVEVQQIPTDLKNEHAISDIDLVVGQMSTVSIVTGEQILDTRLAATGETAATNTFSYTVPVGLRALSVYFDEIIGAGALVQPGDHVDVIAYFEIDVDDLTLSSTEGDDDASEDETETELADESDYTQYVTTYVVQNVEVLAVSQASSPDELGVDGNNAEPTATADADGSTTVGDPVARPEARSVTLAVSPEQVQRLLLASQTVKNEQGSLRLAVRAPGDTTTIDIDPAQLGTIPVGDLLGDVNQAMVPSDLIITEAEFTERILASGTVLEFRVTVKNVSDQTITSSTEAPPEYEYTQGIPYDALGFFVDEGTYRIGLNVSGAFPTQFPYRWGFGGELAPGESVVVVGSVLLTEPTSGTRYWLGVIQEPNLVTQDGVQVSDITVLASETGTVRSRTATLVSSPTSTAEVIVELERGATLEILDVRGPWFLVRSGSNEGWIIASGVRVPELSDTSAAESPEESTSASTET